MSYRPFVQIFLCLLSTFALSGCGDGRPSVYPASGRMLFEGNPMPLGASVSFLPVGDEGVATSGMVDAEGNLEISTFEGQPGLVAGEYRVVVYQILEKEPDQPDADGEIRPSADDTFMAVDADQKIPTIYSDRAKSPLTVVIRPDEENDLGTLELKASP